MSDLDLELNEERREYQKGEAKKYLVALGVIDNFVKKIKQNGGDTPLDTSEVEEANLKIGDLQRFLETEPGLPKRFLHDLGNTAGAAVSNLDLYLMMPDTENATELAKTWDRYKVAVEDNLLRILDSKEVSKEYLKGVDLDALQNVVDFFTNIELVVLSQNAKDQDSAYAGLDTDNRRVIANVDWGKIKTAIGSRKIKGNTGVVANSLLNILRNPLKQQINAGVTELSVRVEGDELILRVNDNGKGMESKHLKRETASESSFIFDSGVSGTGSTGLGLADLNTRVASMEGGLYVVSKKQGSEISEPPVRYQYGGTDSKLDNIDFKQTHGTTFEIRLKLEE